MLTTLPTGRRFAFQACGERVWVVCQRCARWTLLPREVRAGARPELGAAFDAATPALRTENVELARAADGTRLIRLGEAGRDELARWRYGGFGGFRPFWQGEVRVLGYMASVFAIPLGAFAPLMAGPAGWLGWPVAAAAGWLVVTGVAAEKRARYGRVPGSNAVLGYAQIQRARVVSDADGPALLLPCAPGGRGVRLRGPEMRGLLIRLLPERSPGSFREGELRETLDWLEQAGGVDAQLERAAVRGASLGFGSRHDPHCGPALDRREAIALELALHRELEPDDAALSAFLAESEALLAADPRKLERG